MNVFPGTTLAPFVSYAIKNTTQSGRTGLTFADDVLFFEKRADGGFNVVADAERTTMAHLSTEDADAEGNLSIFYTVF